MLIQAATLHHQILQGRPLRIFDCRFALPGADPDPQLGYRQYCQGHIPGARFADLEQDLSGPIHAHSGRHPLPQADVFIDKVQGWGVSPDTPVVVYDDHKGVLAVRLWWMLHHWLGHPHVSVLDGGLNAWTAQALPLQSSLPAEAPIATGYRYASNKSAWIDSASLRPRLGQPGLCLLDARAPARFSGAEETVDPIAGHIPGAINAFCMDNLQANGCFKPVDQLRARFLQLLHHKTGGTDERPTTASTVPHATADIIHYCGSGVTACHNLFAYQLAGLGTTRLYAGSWSEWIRGADNPIACGR